MKCILTSGHGQAHQERRRHQPHRSGITTRLWSVRWSNAVPECPSDSPDHRCRLSVAGVTSLNCRILSRCTCRYLWSALCFDPPPLSLSLPPHTLYSLAFSYPPPSPVPFSPVSLSFPHASLSLCLGLCLPLSVCLSLSLCVSLCLSVCLCLSLSLSFTSSLARTSCWTGF